MCSRRWSIAFILTLGVLCVALPASAEPDAAAASFDRGLTLYQRGEYDAAARAFYQAYQRSPHPDSLYNAGLAWERAGQLATAATAYEIALSKKLKPDARADARSRLTRLSSSLGRVEVSAPEGSVIRVSPFVIREAGIAVYFEPGRHQIRISLPSGVSKRKTVTAEAGETSVVLVEATTPDDPEMEPGGEPSPTPSPDRPSKPEAGSDPTLRILGFASLGVAVVAAGAAALFWTQALDARDEYDANNHTDAEARDRAQSRVRWTNLALATAAIAGVGGGVFLLLSSEAGDDQKPTSALVGVRGSF
jgi:hypothetical protein